MKKPNRNYSFILQREKERLVRIATNRYKISNAILKKKKKKRKETIHSLTISLQRIKNYYLQTRKKRKRKKEKRKNKAHFPLALYY